MSDSAEVKQGGYDDLPELLDDHEGVSYKVEAVEDTDARRGGFEDIGRAYHHAQQALSPAISARFMQRADLLVDALKRMDIRRRDLVEKRAQAIDQAAAALNPALRMRYERCAKKFEVSLAELDARRSE